MLLPTVSREVAPSAEQIQAAEKLGSNIMSPEIKAEYLERIPQQMNDIAQVLDQRAQYFVLSGLYLKYFLVSKQCSIEHTESWWSVGKTITMEGEKSLESESAASEFSVLQAPQFAQLVNGFDVNAVMASVSASITEQVQQPPPVSS